jgi:trehalose 6-phosphate phosphatase
VAIGRHQATGAAIRGSVPVTPAILDAVPTEPGTPSAAQSPLVAALRADPAHSAILTDVDGTLAPIVARPEQAAVPAQAREILRRLSERYGLVGCLSGRRAVEARRLVGVEGIAYAGNHGLELLRPGEEAPRLDPALAGREGAAADFVAGLGDEALAAAGLRLEDKGPVQALHWRGAEQGPAEVRAREIAAAAEQAGLATHWGRKVLELRPAIAIGKDAAVEALLAAAGVEMAAYAGDDRTDLDAFRRLRELREAGGLKLSVCVGVVSPEAPSGLAEGADLTVEGPEGWLAMLEALAA